MSFIVIQKLVIDFSQDAPYLYIGAKSGEINGRTIEFIPVIKGEPIDLSNIVSARFEGKKADGNVILLDGEIKEGHIFVTFTPQSVNVFGLVEAEIGLYGSNMDLAYSQYIYIDVYESIVGDHAHESFPELDSLRIALLTIDKEVKEAKDATKEAFLSAENVNSAAENLENLKTSTVEATENANQSAENANTEAKNALDASLLANEAAQAANEAKDSALSAAKSANDAADRATTIFDDAQSAISYANESAENANEAAGNANFVYEKASTIIPVMEELLEDSEDAIKNANSSAQNANTAANLASDAAQSANDAAVVAMNASKEAMLQEVRQNAVLATNNANNAAEEANQSAKDADLAKEDALLAKQEALSAAESARVEASNANVATQNANNAANAAIEASKEASLQAARDAANTSAESANAAADRATSFLDGAEAAENERNLNEIGRVSAEENRRKEFATWEIELGKISAFDKRIENLEAAVSPGLVTPTVDDSVAYVKDVPTGALPYASVSEVGGMTYNVNGVLRDAKVTAVESVGANLFNIDDLTWVGTKVNDITLSTLGNLVAFANIKVIPNKQYIVSGYAYGVDNSTGLHFVVLDGKDMTYTGSYLAISVGVTVAKKSFSLKFTAQSEWVCFATLATTVELCRVNVGNTDLGWTPYAKNTFEIPEAVQNLDGYGLGINKGCHNKIVLNPADGVKKFVKQNGEIDLGILDWGISYDYFISAYVPNRKPGLNNIIVEGGEVAPTYNGSFDDSFPHGTWGGVANASTITYKMHPNEYADANAFKTAMKGKKLVFELKTPTETDISDYFGDDNLISVEAGGTVKMVNEYGYDVPSVIEYTMKGSDAT